MSFCRQSTCNIASSFRSVRHDRPNVSPRWSYRSTFTCWRWVSFAINVRHVLFCSVLFIPRPVGCIGPHVDAILSCQPPVPWLLPRWCPCFSGCVSRCPSSLSSWLPLVSLQLWNSHCVPGEILESFIRMTCPNHLSLRSLIMSSSFLKPVFFLISSFFHLVLPWNSQQSALELMMCCL